MRVIYDFTARNRQELSVMKGEMVQVRSTAEKEGKKTLFIHSCLLLLIILYISNATVFYITLVTILHIYGPRSRPAFL